MDNCLAIRGGQLPENSHPQTGHFTWRPTGKAKDIVGGAEAPKAAALKIFYFVRDGILFGIDYPDAKASRTLRNRIGFCFTKTNLQIALLRAVGIPARCHYVHLPKELLKDTTPKLMHDRMPAAMAHPWCECYLSGEWIACEALLDEPWYKVALRTGSITRDQIPTIDWDGETNLILFKPWIVKDVGSFSSLDDVVMEARRGSVAMPPSNRLLGWFLLFLINRSMKQIRRR